MLSLLTVFLLVALVCGLAVGVVQGWTALTSGFPLLLLDAVRTSVTWSVVALLAGVILYWLLRKLFRRLHWKDALASWTAVLIPLIPVFLYLGYEFNRQRAIRPSDLLTAYGFFPNLELGLAFLATYILLAWGMTRWSRHDYALPWNAGWKIAGAILALTALLNLSVFAYPAQSKKPGAKPNVIIVLIDALRADQLGCYGNSRNTSPAIDAFSRDAVMFEHAISQSTFTKTSISSLFTSQFPYQTGVYWGNLRDTSGHITSDVLRSSETTLAEVLRARGYLTMAWVQNSNLRSFMGFAQGFVSYNDQQGRAKWINRRFFHFLSGAGQSYPFFAYLHYIDLHDPYRPAPPFNTMFGTYDPNVYAGVDFNNWGDVLQAIRDGKKKLSKAAVEQLRAYYDGLIRETDGHFADLVARLKRQGLYDNSLIIVTADHGDGFMEHGFISHSTIPYDELLHVPLIVKFPHQRFAGRKVTPQVRLIDVMPTIIDEVRAKKPNTMSGCSLMPLLEEPQQQAQWIQHCGYSISEIAVPGAYPVVAVRTAHFKYIHFERRQDEFYDLDTDPGEHHNLYAEGGKVMDGFKRIALNVVAKRREDKKGRVVLNKSLIRRLKAMGYMQ